MLQRFRTNSGYTTGGGFSFFAGRPKYQNDVVKAYLASSLPFPPRGAFNPSGRGFADVAALGANILVFANDGPALLSGTSASTPLVAALFTLLNGQLLNQGLPPVGFSNPALYKLPRKAFTETLLSSNTGCQYSRVPMQGFNSTTGWNPLSGLGTPVFSLWEAWILEWAKAARQRRQRTRHEVKIA